MGSVARWILMGHGQVLLMDVRLDLPLELLRPLPMGQIDLLNGWPR